MNMKVMQRINHANGIVHLIIQCNVWGGFLLCIALCRGFGLVTKAKHVAAISYHARNTSADSYKYDFSLFMP